MKKIVILEDDITFQNTIIKTLETTEDLTCVASLSTISDLLNQLSGLKADLFWLDISLPDGSGFECIPAIKENFPNAYCLICSLNDDDENIFNALKYGADGYILKNTTINKMVDSVYEIIAGGSPMSPFIARKVLSSFRDVPGAQQNSDLDTLTHREQEILSLIAQGFLYKEIALQLNVSYETVKKHLQNIYKKLHVQNRSEAIVKYLNHKR